LGFSSANRRIRARISAVVFGLPPRGRDRHFQKSRNPAWCHRTTVSGLTMIRTSAQRGQTRRRAVQKNRSTGFNRGRGRFRSSTASCCRRARISSAVSTRLQKKTRTTAGRARMLAPLHRVGQARRIRRESGLAQAFTRLAVAPATHCGQELHSANILKPAHRANSGRPQLLGGQGQDRVACLGVRRR